MSDRIVARFDIPGMSAAQYDQVLRDLEQAGQLHPPARQYHVASPQPGGWFVTDVWTSAEALQAFAGVLMPILIRNGVTPPPPRVLPVHHTM